MARRPSNPPAVLGTPSRYNTTTNMNDNNSNIQVMENPTTANEGVAEIDPQAAQEFLTRPKQEPVKPTEPNQTPDKPTVNVPQGETTISKSAEHLFKAIAPTKELFNRGGVMAEIVEDENGHSLQIVDAVAAQSRFENHVEFVKIAGKEKLEVPTVITEAMAKQYLKSEAFRKLLPKINGILQCPMLVEQCGRLHLVNNGYDEVTGYLVINARPVKEMALKQAEDALEQLIENFDFVTPGDRSRALASIITPALKLGGLLKGHIPVDVAEADQSQSGKTYRQKVIAAVYNQKLAVVTKKEGGVGSMEETFNEHLIAGRTFIQFDNVRGKLNSQSLEAFMTSDGTFPARIPYHGGVQVNPSKFVIFITSNGFDATKDLANRSSIIRIRKREGHLYPVYEDGNDLLAQVFKWQPEFLGAVFTVIRHWHEQGKKRTKETRHDFKEWCQSLDWIVQNILGESPLMDGHQDAKARTSDSGLTFLRQVAMQVKLLKRLGQSFSATDLFELCDDAGIPIPGIAEGSRHDADTGKKQIGKIMGGLFTPGKDSITVEDVTVARGEERVTTQAGNPQPMKKYYFFSTEKPPSQPDAGQPAASPAPLGDEKSKPSQNP